MDCVAVTVGGRGTPWLFESRAEAEEHPLVQPGDAVVARASDLFKQYSLYEIEVLLRVVGDGALSKRVLASLPEREVSERIRTERFEKEYGQTLFKALVAAASPPPSDPAEVCRLIREDRKKWKKESLTMAKDSTKGKPATAKKADAPKKSGGGRGRTFNGKDTIQLLADKNGKPYGKDNNPKRAGTASATRFAFYKNGMTVDKFLEAGGDPSDLRNDANKKFISITPAPAAAAA